ncbi:MAG: hypothetical protein LBR42_03730 [Candidatus Methanoplasma sp.]|jgi:tetratricopeptide (TPR) repeat protein|nr:hypothetical protein [Candidatus Methanoplasma sp.]
MDKEKALKGIQSNIMSGNKKLASEQIAGLADNFSDDPFTLLTCASLLKVIEDEDGARKMAGRIPGKVSSETGSGLEVSKGLMGLGFYSEAEMILSRLDDNEEVRRERMRALSGMKNYAESSKMYERLDDPTLEDTIIMIEAVSASGEHDHSIKLAEELIAEAPDDLKVQRCFCAALCAGGKSKEAGRFVKDILKKSRSSSDANAVASYYLWVEGKSTSAGAYATKAVKADPSNIIAMEILAYCLVEKGKIMEAKTVAGAINEKEPGNPAIVRILDMCRLAG